MSPMTALSGVQASQIRHVVEVWLHVLPWDIKIDRFHPCQYEGEYRFDTSTRYVFECLSDYWIINTTSK